MKYTRISRFISLVLRHKPEEAGIALDEHGWANVEELINALNKKKKQIDMEMLEEIVCTDEKQRYSFNEDKTLIRANQGHSIPVDVELEEVQPPEELWHGSSEKAEGAIAEEGLKSMGRLYVHLSKDKETALKVGKRHGKPILYLVKSKEMYVDGYPFYLSKNGMWLTKEVPAKYLHKQTQSDLRKAESGRKEVQKISL